MRESSQKKKDKKEVEQGTKREEVVIYISGLSSSVSSRGYDLPIFDDDTTDQSSK